MKLNGSFGVGYLIYFFCIFNYFRYHPACVGMTIEEAKKLDHFVCSECASEDDAKRTQNGFSSSPIDAKVRILSSAFV